MQRVLLLSGNAAYVAAAESALRAESVLLRQEASLVGGLVIARKCRPRLLLLDLGLSLGEEISAPGRRAGITGG